MAIPRLDLTTPRDPLENLELLSAACVLAPQLFRQRGEAFGVSGEWQILTAAERTVYIDFAIELLLRVQPAPPATIVPFPEKSV